ncbi:MAG TPA: hypothetical protein VFF78_00570 [Anaerolineaceae bacterium]|nr:hypothetical protein [Anaerolineaceae bacterium]
MRKWIGLIMVVGWVLITSCTPTATVTLPTPTITPTVQAIP